MLQTFFKTIFKTIFKTFFKTFFFLVNWGPGTWAAAPMPKAAEGTVGSPNESPGAILQISQCT